MLPSILISRDGEQFGPFSPEEVQHMLQAGQVLPTDFFWQEGMEGWGVVSDQWQQVSTPPQSQTTPRAPTRPTLSPQPSFSAPVKPPRTEGYSPAFIFSLIAAMALLAIAAAYFVVDSFRPSEVEDFNDVSTQEDFHEEAPSPPLRFASTPQQTPTPQPAQIPSPTPAPRPPQIPSSTPVPPPVARPSGDHLRVVVWNIQWYPGRKQNTSARQAANHETQIKEELQKLSPDIFLAQEIRSWPVFDRLVSSLPSLNTAVVSSFRHGRVVGDQQVAIASRLPVNSAWFENWKAASPTPSRGFSAAVLEIPGSRNLILAYSVHLKSNVTRRGGDAQGNYRQREESVRQLISHVRHMEKLFQGRISTVIVGGDFNTNHDGVFGDRTIAMMVEAGFHNTWSGVPAEARHTWRGGGRFPPTTLDYIFTKGLPPMQAQLLDAAGSDHRPFELAIPLAELRD